MAKKKLAKRATSKSKTSSLKPKAQSSKPKKFVYFFGNGKADGDRTMKDTLGGKGSGLAEMTNAGLPVPPGFTISTDVCTIYYKEHAKIPSTIDREIDENVKKLEKAAGAELGSTDNPLLVSVRSGAKVFDARHDGHDSEPRSERSGRRRVEARARRTDGSPSTATVGSSRCSATSCSRFPKRRSSTSSRRSRKPRTSSSTPSWTKSSLRDVVGRYKEVVQKRAGRAFPQQPADQLKMARDAVFRSWMNPRAQEYRRIYDIPDHIGTAVNVQMMVFGNTGDRSGTGVGFTRNPATGKKEFYGEFLINAQGEDVVAGIRTPQPIRELEQVMPKTYKQLRDITTRLEKHYRDIQDFEFTIQDERLFMLQTRSGKRTGYAAVVIATDLVAEKLITPKEAVLLVDPESLSQLLAPGFDPAEWKKTSGRDEGVAGLTGRRIRSGRVFSGPRG